MFNFSQEPSILFEEQLPLFLDLNSLFGDDAIYPRHDRALVPLGEVENGDVLASKRQLFEDLLRFLSVLLFLLQLVSLPTYDLSHTQLSRL